MDACVSRGLEIHFSRFVNFPAIFESAVNDNRDFIACMRMLGNLRSGSDFDDFRRRFRTAKLESLLLNTRHDGLPCYAVETFPHIRLQRLWYRHGRFVFNALAFSRLGAAFLEEFMRRAFHGNGFQTFQTHGSTGIQFFDAFTRLGR